jgi:hypothetical protein
VKGPSQALKAVVKSRMPFLVPPLQRGRSMATAVRTGALQNLELSPLVQRLRSLVLDRNGRRLVFEEIFRENRWGDPESRSGLGSNLLFTETLRAELPRVIEEFGVRSMLDLPCGDFFWMQLLALDLDYLGGDIVPQLVERNQRLFGDERHRFEELDIVRDRLPTVDLVFCRDCLVHLSYADALRALGNVRRSGSTYLLTTTYFDRQSNRDIRTGDWRTLNLRLPPFGLPPPLRLIDEQAPQEGFRDKALGLWRIADLPERKT